MLLRSPVLICADGAHEKAVAIANPLIPRSINSLLVFITATLALCMQGHCHTAQILNFAREICLIFSVDSGCLEGGVRFSTLNSLAQHQAGHHASPGNSRFCRQTGSYQTDAAARCLIQPADHTTIAEVNTTMRPRRLGCHMRGWHTSCRGLGA